jgi:hypothetical protein
MEPNFDHPFEGASRTVGGSIRGKATGNVFSLADAPDIMQDRIQAQGLVKVYKSCIDTTSDTIKPSMVLKSEVTPSLVPVLKKLSRRYSPISSKFLHHSQPLNLASATLQDLTKGFMFLKRGIGLLKAGTMMPLKRMRRLSGQLLMENMYSLSVL